LSDIELSAIEEEVIGNFDITQDQLDTSVSYSSTGTMIIEPSDISDNDIIAAVESALAAELDIHPSALELSYDNESGILTYVITSDDMGEISNAITSITDEDFISDLYIGNDIQIESIEVSNDIEMSVSMLVDASNVSDANMAA
jgi:hypothetical protein